MADIIVYDRDGNKIEKEGIETIELGTTTEGKTTIFTHGIAMDNVPIAVDFSSGNMTIDGGGYLVRSAIIQKPENLKPENVADGINIAGVVGTHKGGGSGVVTHTVTFMSEDGATVLYEKQVTHGDTCGDVVELGLIDAPTKAPTNTIVYINSGWSFTPGGAADGSALVNVTEDRTIYVAFETATRLYTINYYDGETFLKSVQMPYGANANTYLPTKEDYVFNGWSPSVESVTGDIDTYAVWVSTLEILDDWTTIIANPNSYKVGQKKAVEFNYSDGTSETILFTIVGKGVDKTTAGETAALTFIADNLIKYETVLKETGMVVQPIYSTDNDRFASIMSEAFAAMPEELTNAILEVGRDMFNSEKAKLFVPRHIQLTGTTVNSGGTEIGTPSRQYEYFADGNTKVRTKLGGTSPESYWLEDLHSSGFSGGKQWSKRVTYDGTSYATVYTIAGTANTKPAGLLLGFCIGVI